MTAPDHLDDPDDLDDLDDLDEGKPAADDLDEQKPAANDRPPAPAAPRAGSCWGFPDTEWALLQRAAGRGVSADDAFGRFYELYRGPTYGYSRRVGLRPEDAADGVQGFFEDLQGDRRMLARADRSKGPFRRLYLSCLRNFLTSGFRASTAQKRDSRVTLSLEAEYVCCPGRSPEEQFEMDLQKDIVQRALLSVFQTLTSEAEREQFRDCFGCLALGGCSEADCAPLAKKHGISYAAHRKRVSRWRALYIEIARDIYAGRRL
jgi:DNA-directed RNA polymerase specialized sigma24 family protein